MDHPTRDCRPSHAHGVCWPSWSHSSGDHNRFAASGMPDVTRPRPPIWILLWRRIKKEKQRMFTCSSHSMRLTYDPLSYSQNFDEGLMWADPDGLSRSFSARFAVPSRIFEENSFMV